MTRVILVQISPNLSFSKRNRKLEFFKELRIFLPYFRNSSFDKVVKQPCGTGQ